MTFTMCYVNIFGFSNDNILDKLRKYRSIFLLTKTWILYAKIILQGEKITLPNLSWSWNLRYVHIDYFKPPRQDYPRWLFFQTIWEYEFPFRKSLYFKIILIILTIRKYCVHSFPSSFHFAITCKTCRWNDEIWK